MLNTLYVDKFKYPSMCHIQSVEDLYGLIDIPYAIIDIETTGLSLWTNDKVVGIGIGTPDKEYFLHLSDKWDLELLWDFLRQIPIIIGHNIKFDLIGLLQLGYNLSDDQKIHDTIVMARLVTHQQFPSLGLKDLIKQYISEEGCLYGKEFSEYLKVSKLKHFQVYPEMLAVYCLNDIFNTRRLYFIFKKLIGEMGITNLWEQEIQTSRVAWEMEKYGVMIDKEYCTQAIQQLDIYSTRIEQDIYTDIPSSTNLGSHKQLTAVFNNLHVKSPIQTEKNQPSWSDEALQILNHPLGNKLVKWRAIQKLKTGFFEPYLKRENPIHPQWKNWGTVTGRFSCADENFQQIPVEVIDLNCDKQYIDEKMLLTILANNQFDDFIAVRRAIIPHSPDNVLLVFDYSQMEMRILFYYLNNPDANKYLSDRSWDAHDWAVEKVYGITKEHPDFDTKRHKYIKPMNFGIIYGLGNKSLSKRLAMSMEDTIQFRQTYYKYIPGLVDFFDLIKYRIQTRGYIFNAFGRRYSVDETRWYVLTNYLIQGTGADFVKNRMNKIFKSPALRELNIYLMLQSHDELVFDCPRYSVSDAINIITPILEEPILRYPLPVTISQCFPSYAHKIKVENEPFKY